MLQRVTQNINIQYCLYKTRKTFIYYLLVQIENNHLIDL